MRRANERMNKCGIDIATFVATCARVVLARAHVVVLESIFHHELEFRILRVVIISCFQTSSRSFPHLPNRNCESHTAQRRPGPAAAPLFALLHFDAFGVVGAFIQCVYIMFTLNTFAAKLAAFERPPRTPNQHTSLGLLL